MNTEQSPHIAILMASYNGSRFIESQIRSLTDNTSSFTLHWIDDHSTDDTRDRVRSAASSLGIPLRQWHHAEHLGVPGTFFQLLESVEADLYLFCDQDDIWQPGKIDAAVACLLPDIDQPTLCFSDPLMFNDEQPGVFQRISDVLDMKPPASLQESRSLLCSPAAGQAIAFTRPLRDLFLRHKDIARQHAFMHSWWMYLMARASGKARMLADAPTTLYRRHTNNVSSFFFSGSRRSLRQLAAMWRLQHRLRLGVSRQARGFMLAAPTLPSGPQLDRMLGLAKLVATLDRRQSPTALLRLMRSRAMWPNRRRALWLAAACLCSDAKA